MAHKKLINTFKILLAFTLLTKVVLPSFVIAQAVDGNNSGSDNTISQTTSSTIDINQNNSSETGNSINVSLNTGGNMVDSSTGQSNINTGDATFIADVANETNSSTVESGCCSSPAPTEKITDNNSDSQNTISEVSASTTNVNIEQNANITNDFNVSVSTGGNKISDSTGPSSISTGDVVVKAKVENGPINSTYVVVHDPLASFSSVISNNNSGSTNTIYNNYSFQSKINTDHIADIKNKFNFILDTGSNEITNNLGKASIVTGDIFLALLIKNGPINVSQVELNCCSCPGPVDPKPTTTPTVTPTPTTVSGSGGPSNPTNDGGGGGGGGNDGSSTGERVAAMVLGATGSFWENIFYITFALGSILLGLGLRKGLTLNFYQIGRGLSNSLKHKLGKLSSHLEINLLFDINFN